MMTSDQDGFVKPSRFGGFIGLELAQAVNGRSTGFLNVTDRLKNANGELSSGVVYAMADTCMGRAVRSMIEEGYTCRTIELNLVFINRVAEGRLECEARVIQTGNGIAVLESTVNCNEVPIARARNISYRAPWLKSVFGSGCLRSLQPLRPLREIYLSQRAQRSRVLR